MIINLERNSLFVTNEYKKPCLRAALNFERVVDSNNLSEIGILPIFSIYVIGVDDTEESKNLYREYYKELLVVLSGLFPDVYYINTFEEGSIYCLKESIISTNEGIPTKIPYKTTLKIYKE